MGAPRHRRSRLLRPRRRRDPQGVHRCIGARPVRAAPNLGLSAPVARSRAVACAVPARVLEADRALEGAPERAVGLAERDAADLDLRVGVRLAPHTLLVIGEAGGLAGLAEVEVPAPGPNRLLERADLQEVPG